MLIVDNSHSLTIVYSRCCNITVSFSYILYATVHREDMSLTSILCPLSILSIFLCTLSIDLFTSLMWVRDRLHSACVFRGKAVSVYIIAFLFPTDSRKITVIIKILLTSYCEIKTTVYSSWLQHYQLYEDCDLYF